MCARVAKSGTTILGNYFTVGTKDYQMHIDDLSLSPAEMPTYVHRDINKNIHSIIHDSKLKNI